MTIDDVVGSFVPRETVAKLEDYAALLVAENENQNLISKFTIPDIWDRHILDSAQLVSLAPSEARWADLGSGAGLPGIVIAIITGAPITLIEPRRLRVEFLERVKTALSLDNVFMAQCKSQNATGTYDVITARAVGRSADLITMSRHLAHSETKYLLMKGRTAQSELEAARSAWQGRFALVPSRTDADAAILVAEQVRRRGKR